MSLTQNDLQSIKGIVQEIVQEVVQDSINGSETKMKQYIASQFRIQNMVLDTKFGAIDARFDVLEKHMTQGFKILQSHDNRIGMLEEKVEHIEDQMPNTLHD